MTPTDYLLYDQCVARGIYRGLSDAQQQSDTPSLDIMVGMIRSAVLDELLKHLFDEDAPGKFAQQVITQQQQKINSMKAEIKQLKSAVETATNQPSGTSEKTQKKSTEQPAHAPGPWVAIQSKDGSAKYWISSDRWIGQIGNGSFGEESQKYAQANAWLVASSPDLLRVCEYLTKIVQAFLKYRDPCPEAYRVKFQKWVDFAQEVMQRATAGADAVSGKVCEEGAQ